MARLIFIKNFDNIYIVKGGKKVIDDKWYRKLTERARQLNEDAPWIYSDKWWEMFIADLDAAFMIQDEEWIKELEESLK